MRAVVLSEEGLSLDRERTTPIPLPGEVLVRVLMAGICETDLQLIQGYMGFTGVLGHEFVGVAQSGTHAGRRVVGEINCACERCPDCLAGRRNHCPHRTVIGILNHHGAFADYVCVPERNLHAVPDDLSNEVAVFTEPVAAAFEIPAQIELRSEWNVIVLGDGRLGNLCAQVIAQAGCRVTVVGKHPAKLDAVARYGIETALLTDVIGDASLSRAADVVIDCTGSPTGITTALGLVRPRGTIVLKTTVAGTQTLSLAPFVIDEITLVGSRCGPFDVALDALRHGAIDVAPLVSRTFPLNDALAAMDEAASKATLKVLLDMGT